MFAIIKRERKLEIKHGALNAVHFSEPFFAFEPLPFDEFFHLLVLVFLFPAKIIQNKRGKIYEIAFHKTTEEKIQF